jgi:hypothetical protein
MLAHDISHGNSSKSGPDGGGFDLDQNTSRSVMEYDLSYGNHGSGFLLYSAASHASQSGNVVRFNISYNDASTRRPTGGINVGGRVIDAAVYQNTVVMTRAQPAIKLVGPPSGLRILNNIFVASPAGLAVLAVTPQEFADVRFAGNDYRATGRARTAVWGSAVFSSLVAWRGAIGQEILGGRPTGRTESPLFVGPVSASAGGAGFALRAGSALRRAGLDLLSLFGLAPGRVDYSGRPYHVRAPNIGAQ